MRLLPGYQLGQYPTFDLRDWFLTYVCLQKKTWVCRVFIGPWLRAGQLRSNSLDFIAFIHNPPILDHSSMDITSSVEGWLIYQQSDKRFRLLLLRLCNIGAMGQEEPHPDPEIELKKEEPPQQSRFFHDGFSPEYLRIYYGNNLAFADGNRGVSHLLCPVSSMWTCTLCLWWVIGFLKHVFWVETLSITLCCGDFVCRRRNVNVNMNVNVSRVVAHITSYVWYRWCVLCREAVPVRGDVQVVIIWTWWGDHGYFTFPLLPCLNLLSRANLNMWNAKFCTWDFN